MLQVNGEKHLGVGQTAFREADMLRWRSDQTSPQERQDAQE